MKDWKKIDSFSVVEVKVSDTDVAQFETGVVHEVYSTFALGRDAEWCTRQFAIALKDEDEEGIGTYLNVEHCSPAFVGETVTFRGELKTVKGNQIHAAFVAQVGKRLIAEGSTGQRIISKKRLAEILNNSKNDGEEG